MIPENLEWLGRALLKAVRRLWQNGIVPVERAAKAHPDRPAGPFLPARPQQCGDLLVFVPRGLDSRFIDDVTGGQGYSHVTIDCGEANAPDGKPVMIESTVGRLVEYQYQDEYGIVQQFATIDVASR